MKRRVCSGLVLFLVCSVPPGAAALQDSPTVSSAGEPAIGEPVVATAPVVVDGVTLFRVRGVSAYPAARRAEAITRSITALASDRSIPVESLVVRDTLAASRLLAAGRPLLAVIDADAVLEGVTRQVLAVTYRARIAEAIQAYRRDRTAAALWRNSGKAVAATFALVLGLLLWGKALRWTRSVLERRYRPRIHDLQFHAVEIVRGDQLWRALQGAVRFVGAGVAVLAVYLYLGYVLHLFPWTRSLGQSLSDMLLRPLATLGGGAIRYLPDLIFLVILAVLMRYALRLVRLFFRRVADGTAKLPGFEPEWAQATDRIVRLLMIAFALVIAYPYVPGSGSEAFKGISILAGLMVSLGSSSVISNLLAGQTLTFRRTFKLGDRIKIGEHVGDVEQVRLLTTCLRSPKNEQIVIPNMLILNSEVVNFSTLAHDAGLILHATVGIGYETPWRQVEAMLLEAAGRTPGFLRQPDPYVLQKSLGTFAVEYEINVYCDNPHAIGRLYSALHRSILDVFNEYGVQIMTPAYEGDPERPKVVPREGWFAPPAKRTSLTKVGEDRSPAARR